MLKNFNLIVSTIRGKEEDCISELWYFLKELNDEDINISRTGLPGLIVARTTLDPIKVVRSLREKALSNPWYFIFILKIIPIHATTDTEIQNIKKLALELAEKFLAENDTYRITIRKRLTDLRSKEIIGEIAPFIKNKVNLEKPDKIIWIEIVGRVTGISVIEPCDVVSLEIIRRNKRVNL